MRTSEDRSGPLVTYTGNPCQSTGTSSPVSTGDLPGLSMQVTHGPDRSSEVLIEGFKKYILKENLKTHMKISGQILWKCEIIVLYYILIV